MSGVEMNPGVNPATTGIQPNPPASNRRNELQANLLKKILEAQQQQATQAANEIEGKGQILDIRA